METLTLKVEAVAGTGKSFKADNGNWYKRGRNAKFSDFSSLRKGQEVILTTQGEWVSDYTTVGGTNGQSSSSNASSSNSGNRTNSSGNTGDVISRQSAVKSVLASPVVAQLLKETGTTTDQSLEIVDNLILKYFNYITTGNLGAKVTTPAEALKEMASA